MGTTGTVTGLATPFRRSRSADARRVCDGFNARAGECTLSGNVPFRGFVISSRDATLDSPAATPTSDGYCLTHPNPTLKPSVTFTVAGPTVVWATVVTAKVGAHRYALAGPRLVSPPPDQIIWVVGGGPGGLAAARYAHETLGLADVRVLEAGPAPAPDFYEQPIALTYLDNLLATNQEQAYTPIPPSTSSRALPRSLPSWAACRTSTAPFSAPAPPRTWRRAPACPSRPRARRRSWPGTCTSTPPSPRTTGAPSR